jgi:uroporphyrinogen III methyltransferase / synthase
VTLIGECDLAHLLRDTVVACIGPITAETTRSYGLTPTIVAHEYTVPALARAIVEYYEGIQKTGLRTED